MHTRGIDKGHFAHANDANGRMVLHLGRHFLETVGDAEEKRSVDLVNLHPVGDGKGLLVQLDVALGIGIRIDFAGEDGKMGGFGHAPHEEQASHDESHFDGHGEIEHHREHKSDEQHRDVALGVMGEFGEGAPLTHVVTHHNEHAGQTGHGDVGGQRHGHEENKEENGRVYQTGQTRAAAVVDIGHGARDGARGGNAAEQGRDDVGQPLSHQFLVGVVAIARHAVGHGGGKQTLNGAEHRNDQGSGQQGAEGREGETAVGSGEQAVPIEIPGGDGGKRGGDAPESVADGGNVRETLRIGQGHNDRGHDDGHQRTGHPFGHLLRTDNEKYRGDGNRQHGPIHRGDVSEIAHPFIDKTRGDGARNVQSQKVFDLRGEDGEGDARGEPHHDGIGNELDHAAQAEHPEQHQEDAGHDRGHQQPRQAETLHHSVDDDDESAGGSADLHAASAQSRDDYAGHNGGENPHAGTDGVLHIPTGRGGDGERDGQREGNNADHQPGQQIGREVGTTIVTKVVQNAGTKTKRVHAKEIGA